MDNRPRGLLSPSYAPSLVSLASEGCGALKEHRVSKQKKWRYPSAPRGSYLASPPALHLLVRSQRLQTGLGRTTSRRPVLVPVGRSVGVDRVRRARKKLTCRGPPALPVKLPVDTDPRVKSGEGSVSEVFGAGIDLFAAVERGSLPFHCERVPREAAGEGMQRRRLFTCVNAASPHPAAPQPPSPCGRRDRRHCGYAFLHPSRIVLNPLR
jgi:hypothetical protein